MKDYCTYGVDDSTEERAWPHQNSKFLLSSWNFLDCFTTGDLQQVRRALRHSGDVQITDELHLLNDFVSAWH